MGIMIAVLLADVLVLAVIVRQLWFALTHFRLKSKNAPDKNLPSVSVCIPARNEMHVMTECLESVLANDYAKLEVLVFDDSSEDTTSTLVKAFAHDGVRFIEGTPLPHGWLGKNHALQMLLNEASGTYVLFMDVDTRLSPDSIEQMVMYLQQENAAMVSVLPQREASWRPATFFAPLRYLLDILFHRRSAPAAASAAWIVNRRMLISEQDGFNDYKGVIQPESHLAAHFMQTERYRFLMSTPILGISTVKSWHGQVSTSIRLLFPLLGGKGWHAVAALFDILIVLLPIAGLFVLPWPSLVLLLAFVITYGVYLRHVGQRGWYIAMFLWPLILLQEAWLITISATRYLQHHVTWKGRPIRLNK